MVVGLMRLAVAVDACGLAKRTDEREASREGERDQGMERKLF